MGDITTSRRRLLAYGGAALLAGCGGSDDDASAGATTTTAPPDVASFVTATLTDELDDPALAAALTPTIVQAVFTWKPPTVPLAEVDCLVVYAFGNRLDAAGQALPGPMNENLATVVAELMAERSVPVYAQWEVARVLQSAHGLADVTSIEPDIDANGQPVYLSTMGVADKVVQLVGGPDALGKVGVVAYYDHAVRCVDTSTEAGMDAAVPAEATLPTEYDPESGQEWTRSRERYIRHDIVARLGARQTG